MQAEQQRWMWDEGVQHYEIKLAQGNLTWLVDVSMFDDERE